MNAAVVTAEYLLPTGITAWVSAWTDDPIGAVLDAHDMGARHIRVEPDDEGE